jgi:hypothetical protein
MMQWSTDIAFNAASLTFPAASFVTRRFEAFDFVSVGAQRDIIKVFAHALKGGHHVLATVRVWCLNARDAGDGFLAREH